MCLSFGVPSPLALGAPKSHKTKTYFLAKGDTLAGGTIVDITTKKVIFKKDGELSEYLVTSK